MRSRLSVVIGLVATAIMSFALIPSAAAEVAMLHQGNGNCAAPCPQIAVIFVHGFTGAQETWRNSAGQSFPQLLAEDPAIGSGLDVYSISYESLWNSGAPIVETTNQVAASIDALVKDKRYSRIVLVAHSLGGNISREYLAHVKLRYGHAALSRFRLVITLGTPSNGTALAGFAVLFSGNPQVRSLLDIHKNDFLQFLGQTQIDYLSKRIDNQCNRLEFDAGYEMEPTGPTLIVSRDSAIAGADRSEGFDKNHVELPKPADRQDDVYKWVSGELTLCLKGESRCMESTNPRPICTNGDF
jgi:pimeloyl-ACP methyl ester carboxylesterase